jgi:hypothetical protein
MKNILFIVLTGLILSCNNNQQKEPTLVSVNSIVDGKAVIEEGVGVDKLHVGEATMDSVTKYLGQEFESRVHGTYSVQVIYPKYDASFYYLLNDTTRTIFAMGFNDNFKGKTKMGFEINAMTVEDMIRIYGTPRWEPVDSSTHAHFDKLGIYFGIKTRKEVEDKINSMPDITESDNHTPEKEREYMKIMEHFYDSAYAKDKILDITIGVPGSSF